MPHQKGILPWPATSKFERQRNQPCRTGQRQHDHHRQRRGLRPGQQRRLRAPADRRPRSPKSASTAAGCRLRHVRARAAPRAGLPRRRRLRCGSQCFTETSFDLECAACRTSPASVHRPCHSADAGLRQRQHHPGVMVTASATGTPGPGSLLNGNSTTAARRLPTSRRLPERPSILASTYASRTSPRPTPRLPAGQPDQDPACALLQHPDAAAAAQGPARRVLSIKPTSITARAPMESSTAPTYRPSATAMAAAGVGSIVLLMRRWSRRSCC